MKILFSPSEAKNSFCDNAPLDENSLIFKELFSKRLEILNAYNDFIKNSNLDELKAFFELKNENEVLSFKKDIFLQGSCEAIQRYSGVAYEYLDFLSLDEFSKKYVRENTVIFSNLLGPVLASDKIPNYRLKQGSKIGTISLENFYKKHFKKALDDFLKDEDVIDLRANFYEKFYKIDKKFYSYKFIKNGKTVSHFAKAYRGILLRILAQNNIQNNKDLLKKLPSSLNVLDIKLIKNKEEISLEILD